jgi:hypothetical protein
MDFVINYRYSDYASNFPQNTEDATYLDGPSLEKVSVNALQLTEVSSYATYYPKLEYFYNFKIKNDVTFLTSKTFERLLFFRRSAGILLPIGEVLYHYEYTKSFKYTNYVKNMSAFLSRNYLTVQILTQSNVAIPKNDEVVLVYGTKDLELDYSHVAYVNFSSKLTNFYIGPNRKFDGTITPCEECIQEELLKNYDIVQGLPK